MFDNLDYDSINYFIRVFGRIGFIALVFFLYRLYRILASPLTQKKHQKFIRLFGVCLGLSVVLLIENYLLPSELFSSVVMLFNSISTYILAFYLWHQGVVLRRYTDSDEFKSLSRAMDAMILKLKTR